MAVIVCYMTSFALLPGSAVLRGVIGSGAMQVCCAGIAACAKIGMLDLKSKHV